MSKINSGRLVDHVRQLDPNGLGVGIHELERYVRANCPDEVTSFRTNLNKSIRLGFLEIQKNKVKIPVSCEEEVRRLRATVNFQAKQISILKQIQDHRIERVNNLFDEMEQAAKVKSVRVTGVNWGTYNNQSPENAAREFFWRYLDVTLPEWGIESAQRLSDVSLRVTFTTLALKRDIQHRARYTLRPPQSITDDLTQRRYEILLAARRRFGSNRVQVRDGKIFYFTEAGVRCQAESLEDVNKVQTPTQAQASSGERFFVTLSDLKTNLKETDSDHEFGPQSPPTSTELCAEGPIIVLDSEDSN